MADEFKRLDRELVYKGSIVDFYKDTVKVPNGNVVKWDFIKHQGAAAVVPVMEDGRILMVRQYRNALDRYTCLLYTSVSAALTMMRQCILEYYSQKTFGKKV